MKEQTKINKRLLEMCVCVWVDSCQCVLFITSGLLRPNMQLFATSFASAVA